MLQPVVILERQFIWHTEGDYVKILQARRRCMLTLIFEEYQIQYQKCLQNECGSGGL